MNIHRWPSFGVALLAGLVLWMVMLGLFPLSRAVRAEAGTVLFVTPGGTGTACTQAAPCTLGTALVQAVDGDSVYLGAGTYTGTGDVVATITRSLTLLGGWDGAASGPVTRDPAGFPSLLDGQGERRVLTMQGGITVTLEGLTIQRGYAEGDGGGLHSSGVYLTLRAMTFVSNVATTTLYTRGAGAYVEEGSLVVEDSTFRRNWAGAANTAYGGGIAIRFANPVSVTRCLFESNDSWQSSGLNLEGLDVTVTRFYLADSSFTDNGYGHSRGRATGGYAAAFTIGSATSRVERNVIKGNNSGNDWGAVAIFGGRCVLDRNWIGGNYSWQTSGLYLSDVTAFTATNNIIADNRAGPYASRAVTLRQSHGLLAHNTIAQNGAQNAVMVTYGGSVGLVNNIVVSNTIGVSVTAGCTATLEGTLWGDGAWANGTNWGGAGTIEVGTVNVTGLPDFVDAANGDYHLGALSAAIDAGVPTQVSRDMDGQARPSGRGYDIGADEFIDPTVRYVVNLPAVVRVR